jgi:hypothetical protein
MSLRHCERSEAIENPGKILDCFGADAPRNDRVVYFSSLSFRGARQREPGILPRECSSTWLLDSLGPRKMAIW